jgi:hypothetical protein
LLEGVRIRRSKGGAEDREAMVEEIVRRLLEKPAEISELIELQFVS